MILYPRCKALSRVEKRTQYMVKKAGMRAKISTHPEAKDFKKQISCWQARATLFMVSKATFFNLRT